MKSESEPNPAKSQRIGPIWAEGIWWFALLAIVTLLWCAAYNRWSGEAWRTPVSYTSDSLAEMARAKTWATGEVLPILPKYPSSLGAPFDANWNDYPTSEEGYSCWYGMLVRLFGVFKGSNLTLLAAHLLAAASFYFVGQAVGGTRPWSFVGAVLFSMSHFAFARGMVHMALTYYWQIPLGLLVTWWCISPSAQIDKRKLITSLTVAAVYAIQSSYYVALLLQFLVLASLVCLVRGEKRSRVLFPLGLVAVIFAVGLVFNLDTIYYHWINGPNRLAVTRNYAGLELYALRPAELIFPTVHRLTALQDWARRSYYSQTTFPSENGATYLGIVAVVTLGVLFWVSFRALARSERAPIHVWGILWIMAFSVVGGMNGILGTFGFVYFRGSNRYSIVILTLLLLFLVRELTRMTRRWHWMQASALAAAILMVGLWDQIPPAPTRDAIRKIHQQIASDGKVTSTLEAKLPLRAMIFELPVADYPEVPPIGAMQDYEHFRPYFQSRSLRFSYGSHKGRARENWQREAMELGTANFVRILERYGFSAVLINKKAYADHAVSLLAKLRSAGRSEMLVESEDFISVSLQPDTHPVLPPEFDQHWYGPEGNETEQWRWSSGDAKIILYNKETNPKSLHLSFGLSAIQPRRVEIYAGAKKRRIASVEANGSATMLDLNVSPEGGRTELFFQTARPAELPGTLDMRRLSFRVRNFTVLE